MSVVARIGRERVAEQAAGQRRLMAKANEKPLAVTIGYANDGLAVFSGVNYPF